MLSRDIGWVRTRRIGKEAVKVFPLARHSAQRLHEATGTLEAVFEFAQDSSKNQELAQLVHK
jgi:hypothetical protein